MTVHVGPYEFDHVSYDSDGDVLYLRRGERQEAAETFSTPEGHAVRMDNSGEVIGITIVNAKWLVERRWQDHSHRAKLDRDERRRSRSSTRHRLN
jgi:uncharacterized protein YuzE